jgi:hypothetical protein
MRHIQPIQLIKTELRADSWINRCSPELDAHLEALSAHLQSRLTALPGNWDALTEELGFLIGDRFISRLLLPAFAEQFRGMSKTEIDKMMASFAFENCNRRIGVEAVIRETFTRINSSMFIGKTLKSNQKSGKK